MGGRYKGRPSRAEGVRRAAARRIYGTPEERFWPKVNRTPSCWLWTAYVNPLGYGDFGDGVRVVKAHRFAYELLVGPIPAGLQIDHLCRNPSCVNPDHLEPVTPAENTRRGLSGENMRIKTHCPQGHPYSAENTRWSAGNRRGCRICANAASRRYRANRRAVA